MKPRLLLIDNYDSFTYNLVQRIGELDSSIELRVFRNDKITVGQAEELRPERVIISPGPCTPLEAGISNEIVKHFAPKVPLLGVCLGHQCVGHCFGARIVRADRLMHGKTSMIQHDGKTIYAGLDNPFEATRYHSLIIKPGTLPDCFEITARTDHDEIMGIRPKEFALEGVQFHPEIFLTEVGPKLLQNFLQL